MSKKLKREWTRRPWRKFLTDSERAIHAQLLRGIIENWDNARLRRKLRAARKLIQNRATVRAGRASK